MHVKPDPASPYPIVFLILASLIKFGLPAGIILLESFSYNPNSAKNCLWNISVNPGKGTTFPAAPPIPPKFDNPVSSPKELRTPLKSASALTHSSPKDIFKKSSPSGTQEIRVENAPNSYGFFLTIILSAAGIPNLLAIINLLFG